MNIPGLTGEQKTDLKKTQASSNLELLDLLSLKSDLYEGIQQYRKKRATDDEVRAALNKSMDDIGFGLGLGADRK